jgi:hypothetical protein
MRKSSTSPVVGGKSVAERREKTKTSSEKDRRHTAYADSEVYAREEIR